MLKTCPKCGKTVQHLEESKRWYCLPCDTLLVESATDPTQLEPVEAKAEPLEFDELMQNVMVTTTPTLPGYEVDRILGLVHGLTVRSRGMLGHIIAGLESTFGGEIAAYTKEFEKAKNESLARMLKEAASKSANAVLAVDFETSDVLEGKATIFSCYGTAAIVKPAGRRDLG